VVYWPDEAHMMLKRQRMVRRHRCEVAKGGRYVDDIGQREHHGVEPNSSRPQAVRTQKGMCFGSAVEKCGVLPRSMHPRGLQGLLGPEPERFGNIAWGGAMQTRYVVRCIVESFTARRRVLSLRT
jgi:hypothetical protein